jgi:hypothetical protein
VSGIQPIGNLKVLNYVGAERKAEWALHWITDGLAALERVLAKCAGVCDCAAWFGRLLLLLVCSPFISFDSSFSGEGACQARRCVLGSAGGLVDCLCCRFVLGCFRGLLLLLVCFPFSVDSSFAGEVTCQVCRCVLIVCWAGFVDSFY